MALKVGASTSTRCDSFKIHPGVIGSIRIPDVIFFYEKTGRIEVAGVPDGLSGLPRGIIDFVAEFEISPIKCFHLEITRRSAAIKIQKGRSMLAKVLNGVKSVLCCLVPS